MPTGNNPVIALLVADLHLSQTPPIARASEPDWFAAMRRPLEELEDLSDEHDAPILCAGDVFDRWNPPPELINFAIRYLPPMYAVPGQHDLPAHNYADIQKSAYWTLVEAGKVMNVNVLPYAGPFAPERAGLFLFGFPWGFPPKPIERLGKGLHVALVHEYTFAGECFGFPGSGGKFKPDQYTGFDVVTIGDNHQSWQMEGSQTIWNCGSFMRRNGDQVNHRPRVGLLRQDGTVTPHYLDISQDVLTAAVEEPLSPTGHLDDFIAHVRNLQAANLDWRFALEIAAKGATPTVQQILREALG